MRASLESVLGFSFFAFAGFFFELSVTTGKSGSFLIVTPEPGLNEFNELNELNELKTELYELLGLPLPDSGSFPLPDSCLNRNQLLCFVRPFCWVDWLNRSFY